MNSTPALSHPRELLEPQWTGIMRENAFESERAAKLTDPVTELIYREGWLRLLMPESCGGLEWPLPRTVAFLEALAWADGNAGWCVNLGAGANMFAGYLDPGTAKAIFIPPRTWCAGSGAAGGRARRVSGGYRVSGHWKYASGAAHATHFTANCFIGDESGRPLLEGDASVVRSVIVPGSDVVLHDSWHVTGLKATSSHDFDLQDVFVPAPHVFSLSRSGAFAQGALYRFPFEVMAVVNMACMTTGIAWHFIDLFETLVARKTSVQGTGSLRDRRGMGIAFEELTGRFTRARRDMHEMLHSVWQTCEGAGYPDGPEEQALITAARDAAAAARNLVHVLFPFCGMEILFTGSAMNKTWRDMAAASQHYLLGPWYGQQGGAAG